jgi:hypothetical protein
MNEHPETFFDVHFAATNSKGDRIERCARFRAWDADDARERCAAWIGTWEGWSVLWIDEIGPAGILDA